VSSTVNYYSTTDPTAVRQALGATALSVGALGAGGYAIRRDLSFLYRALFFLLLGLILAGIVLIFVHIEALYTAYALFGLVIFGLYTVVDFNRLRRAGTDEAIPLAAGIFLDVLNIFLLFLRLFARSS
jgi:FtsH-binding integral membrane protein